MISLFMDECVYTYMHEKSNAFVREVVEAKGRVAAHIPATILHELKIFAGDELEWIVETEGDEKVARVRKIKR